MTNAEIADTLLLDTNIFVHAVRGDATWQRIKAAYNPLMREPRPRYSIVTEGEIPSFALQQDWRDLKREQMDFLLGYFERLDLNEPGIINAYVLIDAYSRSVGVKMGKNDLWIAATANAAGATLLTTDRDFDHLDGVFLDRVLIVP